VSGIVPESGALKAWVDLYSQTTEAPPEAHLGAALALTSAAVGWKAWIRWADFSEPATINVILEGRSATARKTTVATTAKELANAATGDVDPAQRGLTCRAIDHTSGKGLIEIVAAQDDETAARWERIPPPGVLLFWDEFGSILGDPRDIRKGGDWLGRVRTTVMQLAGGRHGGVQTGGAKLAPGRCAVAILATMTRVELEERVDTGLLRDGFLGRFTLIPHDGRASYISAPPRWTCEMHEQRQALVGWLRDVAQYPSVYGDIFDLLTSEASQEREHWYHTTARRLDREAARVPTEENLAAVEAFGRLQSTALKIAMVAAVAERNTQAGLVITGQHVAYGQRVAEMCLGEVMDLARHGSGAVADRYSLRVVEYLRKHGPTTRAVLMDSISHRTLDREKRWKAVQSLHPDVVIIDEERTAGRPRHVIRLTDTLTPPNSDRHPHSEKVEKPAKPAATLHSGVDR
jgi:hypothetical protein